MNNKLEHVPLIVDVKSVIKPYLDYSKITLTFDYDLSEHSDSENSIDPWDMYSYVSWKYLCDCNFTPEEISDYNQSQRCYLKNYSELNSEYEIEQVTLTVTVDEFNSGLKFEKNCYRYCGYNPRDLFDNYMQAIDSDLRKVKELNPLWKETTKEIKKIFENLSCKSKYENFINDYYNKLGPLELLDSDLYDIERIHNAKLNFSFKTFLDENRESILKKRFPKIKTILNEIPSRIEIDNMLKRFLIDNSHIINKEERFKRGKMPFDFFKKIRILEIREENPDIVFKNLMKQIGHEWKTLSDKEKYIEMARKAK